MTSATLISILVAEFMTKHNFRVLEPMIPSRERSVMVKLKLTAASVILSILARLLIRGDTRRRESWHRSVRAHLMCEELGEVLTALRDGDEVALLDGLCDLVYVTVGTAVQFDLPFEAAFMEVHRSNMTKATRGSNDKRLRDKGASWIPPDIRGVIRVWRSSSTQ